MNSSNITHNKPLLQTPQKPVAKPPIQNIIKLLEQIVRARSKRPSLLKQVNLLTDGNCSDFDTVDKIEKIEDELKFIDEYTQTLYSQAVVIMNEHNVLNIPSLDSIEKNLLTYDTTP